MSLYVYRYLTGWFFGKDLTPEMFNLKVREGNSLFSTIFVLDESI